MIAEERFAAKIKESTWAEWVDGRVVRTRELCTQHARNRMFAMCLIGGFVDGHDLGTSYGRVHVRFPSRRSRRQPDVTVVATANGGRVKECHIDGPPDLICEVVAEKSRIRDRVEKFADYEAAGVPEYWLIDRPAGHREAYAFAAGRYDRLPEVDGEVCSALFSGLFFRPEWIRQPDHPPILDLLKTMSARRLLSTPSPSPSDNPNR